MPPSHQEWWSCRRNRFCRWRGSLLWREWAPTQPPCFAPLIRCSMGGGGGGEIGKLMKQKTQINWLTERNIENLPLCIKRNIENLPLCIERNIENLPQCIKRNIENLPQCIERNIENLPQCIKRNIENLPPPPTVHWRQTSTCFWMAIMSLCSLQSGSLRVAFHLQSQGWLGLGKISTIFEELSRNCQYPIYPSLLHIIYYTPYVFSMESPYRHGSLPMRSAVKAFSSRYAA